MMADPEADRPVAKLLGPDTNKGPPSSKALDMVKDPPSTVILLFVTDMEDPARRGALTDNPPSTCTEDWNAPKPPAQTVERTERDDEIRAEPPIEELLPAIVSRATDRPEPRLTAPLIEHELTVLQRLPHEREPETTLEDVTDKAWPTKTF